MTLQLEDEFQYIIQKARYGLGLSLEQMAQRANVTVHRLQALEEGMVVPSKEEVRTLAHALSLNSGALWNIVQGWTPTPPDMTQPYRVETFCFSGAQSNGYIVQHEEKDGVIVIDPGGLNEKFLGRCRALADQLVAVLLTHTHADHIAALDHVTSCAPGVPIVVHAAGKAYVGSEKNVTYVTGDGTLQFGSFTFDVLEMPGHSPDGVTYQFNNIAFCGDTLFAGSLGRSQHGRETYDTLLKSARRLVALPEQTILFPGHGPATTVAEEKRNNAFIATDSL